MPVLITFTFLRLYYQIVLKEPFFISLEPETYNYRYDTRILITVWHTDAYTYSTSRWICATSTTCISLVIVSSYQIFDYKSLRTLIWKTTYSEGQICCHLTLLSTKLIHFHSILKLNIYHERNIIFLICVLATLLHRMIMREQQFAFFSFNIML